MNPAARRRSAYLTAILAIVILTPALFGFGTKFREFLVLAGDADGGFTVVPILNYLLVTGGFLLLFVWAMLHGMFRHIEQPKYDMLATEQRLDAELEAEEAADKEGWNGRA